MNVAQVKPMLAAGTDEYWLRKACKSKEWVGEVKYDGSRYIAHFQKDRLYFTSRRESVKDGLLCEKGLNLPHLNKAKPKLTGTIIDGEIMGPGDVGSCVSIMGALPEQAVATQKKTGWAVYHVFDILFYKGKDVKQEPLEKRREWLVKAVKEWDNPNVSLVGQESDKTALYEQVVGKGGEGIILKNLKAPYEENARRKEYWIKWKKQKVFDCIIMGFTKPDKHSVNVNGERCFNRFWVRGWISAVKFGVYKGDTLVEIGQTSGMSDTVRKDISKNPDKYVGKAVEIEGQELTKYGVIRHPRWVRLREDLNPQECSYKKLVEGQNVKR